MSEKIQNTSQHMPLPSLFHSLVESGRCLGVAQEKGDKDAMAYWSSKVDEFVAYGMEFNKETNMTENNANEKTFEEAFEEGKLSALAQIKNGQPVLMIDEMDLSDLAFANARGWNSVFASEENGKLLKSLKPA